METEETVPWWALRYEAMATLDPALLGTLDGPAEEEVAFAVRALKLKAGEQLLDVACGTGLHARIFHAAGFPTTGIDLSPRLLRLARDGWQGPGAGPVWMPGDMRWLPRAGPFDAATIFGPSLGFFEDDEEHRRCLSSVLDLLRPGGRICCNLLNPYHWASRAGTSFSGASPEGEQKADLVRTSRFEAQRGRVEERAVAFLGATRLELPPASIRAWTPAELQSLFRAAGFRRVHIYGSDGLAVPEELLPVHALDSVFLWIVAES
jgi:SAM-dependent methyltransferase